MPMSHELARSPIWIIPGKLGIWNYHNMKADVVQAFGFRSAVSMIGRIDQPEDFGVEVAYGLYVRDSAENLPSVLHDAVAYIAAALDEHAPTLVFCLAGMSRSVCAVAGYLVIAESISAAEALERIAGCYENEGLSIGPSKGMLEFLSQFERDYYEL